MNERNTAMTLNGFLRIRGSRRQVNTAVEKLTTVRSLIGIKVKANRNTNVMEEHMRPLNITRNIFFNVFLAGIFLSDINLLDLLSLSRTLKTNTCRAPLTRDISPAESSDN